MTQPTRTEASTGLDRPLTPFVHPLPLPPRYQVTEPDPAHRACRGGTAPVPLRVGGEPDPAAVALLARPSTAASLEPIKPGGKPSSRNRAR